MKQIIAKGQLVRQNMLSIIGFCLFCYFSYHAVFGDRGYIRLLSLEKKSSHVEAQYRELHQQRLVLESKVTRLRPDTLDRDLLEERVHYVLGYYHNDTHVIAN